MNKSAVLSSLLEELKSQLDRIVSAASEARSYATDPDSKAENKYDTRTVEASYLAAGQAAKAAELAATVDFFTSWSPPDFSGDEPIAVGALVTLAYPDGGRLNLLLAPKGGGIVFDSDGQSITVITPQAPLFQTLEGRRQGDETCDLPFRIVEIG